MKQWVAKHVRHIDQSPTLALSRWAAETKGSIDLTAGQLFNPPPDVARKALIAAASLDSSFRYAPAAGIPELRLEVAKLFSQKLRQNFKPENIFIGHGAKGPLSEFLHVVLEPGIRVLTPIPAWPSYESIINLRHGNLIGIPTTSEKNYKLLAEDLDRALPKEGRAILLLVNPSNPTGSVYTANEMQKIAEVIRTRPEVIVIEDVIYWDLVYPEYENDFATLSHVASDLLLDGRIMLIGGVSKSHAMTGIRLGWGASLNKEIIERAIAAQSHETGNIAILSQVAALAALRDAPDYPKEVILDLNKKRKVVFEILDNSPLLKPKEMPGGAFYYFLDTSPLCKASSGKLESGDHFASMLKDQMVVVVPGGEFGDKRSFRLSYSGEQRALEQGLSVIIDTAKRIIK